MTGATILAPRTVEEAAEFVRAAARERTVIRVVGSDTKCTWTRPADRVPPKRIHVELSTLGMSGIVAYEPGDGVITALAGTPWSEVEALVAQHGHHVSPRIPDTQRATVGGVVAAGQSGLDRLRYGPLRDHVLGMRVVTADGAIAKSGGRLVKNVTGFDLHRLHTGAHGTLGMIAEVSLRLHAAPELHAVGLADLPTREAALELARGVLRASRAAWNVSISNWVSKGAPRRWMVHVHAAGLADVIESEVQAASKSSPNLHWRVARPGTRDENQVPITLSAGAMFECIEGSWPTVRVTCTPSSVERVCDVLESLVSESNEAPGLVIQPGIARVDAWSRVGDASTVARISGELIRVGARVHWCGLDDDLRGRVDLHGGEEPAGLALMRRIRANLDPHGVFASGHPAGGL